MTAAHIEEAEAYLARNPDAGGDPGPCEQCGRVWPLAVLDAKPWPGPLDTDEVERVEEETGQRVNFERFEGPCCYGPGYCTP